jgi:hypothetical protein
MDRHFLWFESTPKGIGRISLRVINQGTLEEHFAYYLLSIEDRQNLSNVPKLLKKVKEETINAHTGPEKDRWNDDKENYFRDIAKKALETLLNTELRSLVDKYLSNVSWVGDLHLEEDDEDWELEDLTHKETIDDFTGNPLESGRANLEGDQQKLIDDDARMKNEEFFTNPKITVKSDTDTQIITARIEIDHTSSGVPQKIFREAFPRAKIITEEAPASLGRTIRSESNIISYEKQKSELTSMDKNPDAIWYTPQGRKPTEKKIERQNKELERMAREEEAYTGELAPTLKDYRERKAEWMSSRAKEVNAEVAAVDDRHTIELVAAEAEELHNIIFESFLVGESIEGEVRQFIERVLIKNEERLYDHLIALGVDMNPKYLQHYTITLLIPSKENEGLVGNNPDKRHKLFIPAKIDTKPKLMISQGMLGKIAQQKKQVQTKWRPLSIHGRAAMGTKDTEPTKGFNEARDYLASQVKNNVKKLVRAAPYLRD